MADDLLFHKDHCWVRVNGETAQIGITDYAQEELGKIIYIGLPEAGDQIEEGEPFGEIESRKSVSELIAPLGGEVLEVHAELEEDPSVINEAPYEDGWMILIQLSDLQDLDSLLSESDYMASVQG